MSEFWISDLVTGWMGLSFINIRNTEWESLGEDGKKLNLPQIGLQIPAGYPESSVQEVVGVK